MEKTPKCPWCGGKMEEDHPFCVDAIADFIEENTRLRFWLWHGWHEMNAIRAESSVPRSWDGTPKSISEDYWSKTVDAMADVLGDDAKPWPPKLPSET